MNRRNFAVRTSAAGVFAALSVVALWISSLVPVADMTLIAVAGVSVYLATTHYGFRTGIPVYLVSSALALLIVPGKTALLPYFFLFGPYGFLKPLLEKIPLGGARAADGEFHANANPQGRGGYATRYILETVLSYFIKIAVGAVLAGAGFLIFGTLFLPQAFSSRFGTALVVIGGIAFLLLYDSLLRLFGIVLGRYLPKTTASGTKRQPEKR